MISNYQQDGLINLGENGQPPETTIATARQAQDMGLQLIRNDKEERGKKRALVAGIVDGNPPYRRSDKIAAGRAQDCNVNWRIAESYLDSAKGAFYDLFSESPTFATVKTAVMGDGSEQWSQIITEEFDRLQRRDASWDAVMQLSQGEMCLYGIGPLVFKDKLDWRCDACQAKELLVPDEASSDTKKWEYVMLRVTYLPHELYSSIRNSDSAREIGWDVSATRQAIMDAQPVTEQGGEYMDWEWHQMQLKCGAYNYSFRSKSIRCFHVFYREFPKKDEPEGKISHAIVLQDAGSDKKGEWLYRKIGCFDNWQECIHPMYYSHGRGGKHHSVTGMGVKMFSAMEYQNRLLCNLADKAFAPKVLFRPTTATAKQKFGMVTQSDFGILPTNYEVVQTPMQGLMQDGLILNREVTGLIASNLSQYRQNIQRESGNPVTAREIDFRASEQARLGKTQLNRYYEQLDAVYAEKYRRASNPKLEKSDPGGEEALEFQKRCKDRGVPAKALTDIDFVQATRVVGQGSSYMRQQTLEFLLGMVAMLPEDGRENVIRDVIAARSGQSMVRRYFPAPLPNNLISRQQVMARQGVTSMKIGMDPGISADQNPAIFAQTYLMAGAQAMQSIQQGANPVEVSAFLDMVGPAAAQQIERMAGDPTRKAMVQPLIEQLQQMGKFNDQLKVHIQEQQEAQQKQAQEQQQAAIQEQLIQSKQDPKTRILAAQMAAKIQDQALKTKAQLTFKAQKHQQGIALADASTAATIQRENALAEAELAGKE